LIYIKICIVNVFSYISNVIDLYNYTFQLLQTSKSLIFHTFPTMPNVQQQVRLSQGSMVRIIVRNNKDCPLSKLPG